MKKIIKRNNGEGIPRFYGVAYVRYETNELVCYPLFINLLVLLFRESLFWLKNPKGHF